MVFSEILAISLVNISGVVEVGSIFHPKNSDSLLAVFLLIVGVITWQCEALLYT